MRVAVAMASAQAPDSTFVVWQGFQESVQKASDFGYDGAQLVLQSADDIVPDHLAKWLIAVSDFMNQGVTDGRVSNRSQR